VKLGKELSISVVVELSKTPPSMFKEKSLLSFLKAKISLSLILPDLAIDFSIRWFLLVRVFFN
jgi:hypothetical protein